MKFQDFARAFSSALAVLSGLAILVMMLVYAIVYRLTNDPVRTFRTLAVIATIASWIIIAPPFEWPITGAARSVTESMTAIASRMSASHEYSSVWSLSP